MTTNILNGGQVIVDYLVREKRCRTSSACAGTATSACSTRCSSAQATSRPSRGLCNGPIRTGMIRRRALIVIVLPWLPTRDIQLTVAFEWHIILKQLVPKHLAQAHPSQSKPPAPK